MAWKERNGWFMNIMVYWMWIENILMKMVKIKVYSEKVNGPTKEKLTDIIAVPINHWITLQNTHLKGLPWFLFTFQKAENTHFNTGTNRKHLNNT